MVKMIKSKNRFKTNRSDDKFTSLLPHHNYQLITMRLSLSALSSSIIITVLLAHFSSIQLASGGVRTHENFHYGHSVQLQHWPIQQQKLLSAEDEADADAHAIRIESSSSSSSASSSAASSAASSSASSSSFQHSITTCDDHQRLSCAAHATCYPMIDTYECRCDYGFEGNPYHAFGRIGSGGCRRISTAIVVTETERENRRNRKFEKMQRAEENRRQDRQNRRKLEHHHELYAHYDIQRKRPAKVVQHVKIQTIQQPIVQQQQQQQQHIEQEKEEDILLQHKKLEIQQRQQQQKIEQQHQFQQQHIEQVKEVNHFQQQKLEQQHEFQQQQQQEIQRQLEIQQKIDLEIQKQQKIQQEIEQYAQQIEHRQQQAGGSSGASKIEYQIRHDVVAHKPIEQQIEQQHIITTTVAKKPITTVHYHQQKHHNQQQQQKVIQQQKIEQFQQIPHPPPPPPPPPKRPAVVVEKIVQQKIEHRPVVIQEQQKIEQQHEIVQQKIELPPPTVIEHIVEQKIEHRPVVIQEQQKIEQQHEIVQQKIEIPPPPPPVIVQEQQKIEQQHEIVQQKIEIPPPPPVIIQEQQKIEQQHEIVQQKIEIPPPPPPPPVIIQEEQKIEQQHEIVQQKIEIPPPPPPVVIEQQKIEQEHEQVIHVIKTGCVQDSDCPLDRKCNLRSGECYDPCPAHPCGENALCRTENHTPECYCPPAFPFGDPHRRCFRDKVCGLDYRCPGNLICLDATTCGCPVGYTREADYCFINSVNCTTDNPCPTNEECVYVGGDRSPAEFGFCVCPPGYELHAASGECIDLNECAHVHCAFGAICENRAGGGHDCSCPPRFVGEPYRKGCVEIDIGCFTTSDCADDRVCDTVQHICISPCHICGPHAQCTAVEHTAICACPPPRIGNPLDKSVGCVEEPEPPEPPRPIPPPSEIIVKCLADGVQATIRLDQRFDGMIYVKGHSQDPRCRHPVSAYHPAGESDSIDFHVRFGTCGMTHDDIGEAAFVLVVQAHRKLVTYRARAYVIRCVYDTGEKTITFGFNTSVMTTAATIANTGPPPTIIVSIGRRRDGHEVSQAEIGDELVLRADVQPDFIYGGFAKNCIAKTTDEEDVASGGGVGEVTYPVTDERGCAIDPAIFGNWQFDPHRKSLTAKFNAFKFLSGRNLRFQCSIRVCFGSCPPVNCDGVDAYGRRRRRRQVEDPNDSKSVPNDTLIAVDNEEDFIFTDTFKEGALREEIQVQSNAILTFERRDRPSPEAQKILDQLKRQREEEELSARVPEIEHICLAKWSLILSVLLTALLALVAVAIAISCWLMAARRAGETSKSRDHRLPHPTEVPNPLYYGKDREDDEDDEDGRQRTPTPPRRHRSQPPPPPQHSTSSRSKLN